MAREGILLQTDGSRHDWLEGRGPILTLVGGIDDATSNVTGATFCEQEDAAGYFIMLTQTADRFGLPGALYSDRHGIFVKNRNRPPILAEPRTLRARHLRRPSPEIPVEPSPLTAAAAPTSGPVKLASTHPWRRYPVVRPR